MRHLYAAILIAFTPQFHAQTISTVGFSFEPALLTVTAGTEISLNIGGGHTMTEVDETTWNANGSTSNDGFNYSTGQHTLILDEAGTYYYVCVPHSGSGMKGRILVDAGTGISPQTSTVASMTVDHQAAMLLLDMPTGETGTLVIHDLQGREVMHRAVLGTAMISVAGMPRGQYVATLLNAHGEVGVRQRFVTGR